MVAVPLPPQDYERALRVIEVAPAELRGAIWPAVARALRASGEGFAQDPPPGAPATGQAASPGTAEGVRGSEGSARTREADTLTRR
jgi:hypothetical protein